MNHDTHIARRLSFATWWIGMIFFAVGPVWIGGVSLAVTALALVYEIVGAIHKQH